MKKVSIILSIAFCFNVSAQDKAIDSLQKLIVVEKNYKKKANYWFQIAGYCEVLKKGDSAHNYAVQKSFENVILAKNDTLLGFFYSTLGMYYEEKPNLNLSIEYQLKALAIFEEMHYTYGICLASEQTAVVYKELKNVDEAYRYLLNAKKYIGDTAVKKSFIMRAIHSNLADIFLFKGILDSALFYNQLSDRFTEKDDVFGISRNLFNYAVIYDRKKDFDLAEAYYRKTIVYADSNYEYINYIEALTNFSKYFLSRNKIDSSFAYAKKSWEKHKLVFGVGGILSIDITDVMQNIYFKMGKYDSAYHYAILNKNYSDSIYNQQKLNNIQDQTYARKIYEIESASKQKEIVQEHKKNIQFVLVALGLITLLVAFLLLSRSFITNTKFIEFFGTVAMLMVFEFLNLLLHPFLEKITHHSLILMLLALVFIAAILVPLHHKIEKWAIEKLVKKNKEIRLANAKQTIEQLKDIQ